MVAVGDPAPDFALPADDGRVLSLKEFRGRKVVLYFYPKDDTPGCTKEACSFRDNLARVTSKGAVILGVSRDDSKSHVKFKDKYNLNFPLLSDDDGRVTGAYGVWKKKNLYGREYFGIERTTFLMTSAGRSPRSGRGSGWKDTRMKSSRRFDQSKVHLRHGVRNLSLP